MKKEIAKSLLDIGAVGLSPSVPYTWSSGLKSPIYCDNRLTISYPEIRKKIAQRLADLIRVNFPETNIVAGTATAGIPHAAWVSEILNLPMCYIRGKAKAHGAGKQIEGLITPGSNVVIVEDLISTGGSSLKAVEAAREAGCDVLGVVAIFSYGLDAATEQFQNAGVPYYTISDYEALIEVAIENGKISSEELAKLKQWRKNPKDESWLTLNS
ncbi:MAG: pyrE [Bacillales bacterium]|jgi:orotate phosphoribosyltransferase|nr:pyrE [Bacillales bacterium]